jgi:hypothetical protein
VPTESRRVEEEKKHFPFRKDLPQLTVLFYIIIYNLGLFFLGTLKQFFTERMSASAANSNIRLYRWQDFAGKTEGTCKYGLRNGLNK